MREELPGYDTSYRSGKDPVVEAAFDKLNGILEGHGGVACLDEEGNIVKRYTDRVVLDLPNNLPEDVVTQARAAALGVLQAMHQKKET